MKERPILLTGREVRATMSGQKPQARRLVHPDFQWLYRLDTAKQPDGVTSFCVSSPDGTGLPLRLTHVPAYPGDRLWVRETFALEHLGEDGERVVWKADRAARWTPAVQMPRRLSRITLDIASVRVERLQSVSDDDAKAEGLKVTGPTVNSAGEVIDDRPGYLGYGSLWYDPRRAFETIWNRINGKKAPWPSNPWVWIVEFKVADVAGRKEAA